MTQEEWINRPANWKNMAEQSPTEAMPDMAGLFDDFESQMQVRVDLSHFFSLLPKTRNLITAGLLVLAAEGSIGVISCAPPLEAGNFEGTANIQPVSFPEKPINYPSPDGRNPPPPGEIFGLGVSPMEAFSYPGKTKNAYPESSIKAVLGQIEAEAGRADHRWESGSEMAGQTILVFGEEVSALVLTKEGKSFIVNEKRGIEEIKGAKASFFLDFGDSYLEGKKIRVVSEMDEKGLPIQDYQARPLDESGAIWGFTKINRVQDPNKGKAVVVSEGEERMGIPVFTGDGRVLVLEGNFQPFTLPAGKQLREGVFAYFDYSLMKSVLVEKLANGQLQRLGTYNPFSGKLELETQENLFVDIPRLTTTPEPTATNTSEVKEDQVLSEVIEVGETALGNSINMEMLSQGYNSSGKIIWLIGGVHPEEITGNNGYLKYIRSWLKKHPEEWSGYRIVLGDYNPDGKGRLNPNGVNLMRNSDYNWHEVAPEEKTKCSPDGTAPNSEPETQAIMNSAVVLMGKGEVVFFLDLHRYGPTVDPAHCFGPDDEGCRISKRLAEILGIPYGEFYTAYGCKDGDEYLAGQPDDALRKNLGLYGCTLEFPYGQPSEETAAWLIRGVVLALSRSK